MPRRLKEIKAFQTGTVHNSSERDISDDTASFSLNIDPMSENGTLDAIKNDRIVASFDNTLTRCLYPVSWGSSTQTNESASYNTSSVIIEDLSIFNDRYEDLDIHLIGTKGRKEKLKAIGIRPWWERVAASTTVDVSHIPAALITDSQDFITYLDDDNPITLHAVSDDSTATIDGGGTTFVVTSGFAAGANQSPGVAVLTAVNHDESQYAGKYMKITTPDGLIIKYRFYNDTSGNSGTQDGAYTKVQLYQAASAEAIIDQIELAVGNATYGHSSRIALSQSTGVLTLTYVVRPLRVYLQGGDYLAFPSTTINNSTDEIMKVESVTRNPNRIYVTRNAIGSPLKTYAAGTSFQVWSNRLTIDARQIRTQRGVLALYDWSNYSGNNIGGNGNWIYQASNANDKENLGVIDTSADTQTITFSNSAKTISFNNLGATNTLLFNEGDTVTFYYGGQTDNEPNNGKSFKILKSERTDSNADWTWTVDTAPADDTEVADTVYMEANLIKNHTFHHAIDEANPDVDCGSGHAHKVNNWVSKQYQYVDAAGETAAAMTNAYVTSSSVYTAQVASGGYWEDATADHGADNAANYYPFDTDDAYMSLEAEYKDSTHNLTAAATADDDFLAVGDKSKFAIGDILKVTNASAAIEYMKITSMTSNKLFVNRGHFGTTAVAHESGRDVFKSINPSISQDVSKDLIKSGQSYTLTFHAKDFFISSTKGVGYVSIKINGGYINEDKEWVPGSLDNSNGYSTSPENIMQEDRWINFKKLHKVNRDTAYTTGLVSILDTTWRRFEVSIHLPKGLDILTDLNIEFSSRGPDGTKIGIDLVDLSEMTYLAPVSEISKVQSMGVISNANEKNLVSFDSKSNEFKIIPNFDENKTTPYSTETNIEKSDFASTAVKSRDGKATFVSKNRETHIGFGSGADDSAPQWLGYLNHKTFGVDYSNLLYQDEDTIHNYDTAGLISMSKIALAGEHENLTCAWDGSADTLDITHTNHSMVIGNNIVVREWLDTDNSWDGNGVWVVTSVPDANSIVCKRIDVLDADPGSGPAGNKISYRPYYYYGIRDGDSHIYRIIPDAVYTDATTVNVEFTRGKIEKSLPQSFAASSISTCYNKDITNGIGGGRIYILTTGGEIKVLDVQLPYNKWSKENITTVSTSSLEYKSYTWSNDNSNGNINGDTAVFETLAEESTPTIIPAGIPSDILETKGTTKDFVYDAEGQQDLDHFDTRLWIQFRPPSGETFTYGDRFLFCGLTNATNTDSSSHIFLGDRTPPTNILFPKRYRWINSDNENDHMFFCGPGLHTTSNEQGSGADIGDFEPGLIPHHAIYQSVRHGGSHSEGYKREKLKSISPRTSKNGYASYGNIDEEHNDDANVSPGLDYGSNVGWEADGGKVASIKVAKYGLIPMGDNNCDGVIDGTGLVTCSNQSLTQVDGNRINNQNLGPYGYEHEQVCSHAVGLIGGSDVPWIRDWGAVLATDDDQDYYSGIYGRAPQNMKADKVLFICSDIHFGDREILQGTHSSEQDDATLYGPVIEPSGSYVTSVDWTPATAGALGAGTAAKIEAASGAVKGLKPGDLVYIDYLGTGVILKIDSATEFTVSDAYSGSGGSNTRTWMYTFYKYIPSVGVSLGSSGIGFGHHHWAFDTDEPLNGEIFTDGDLGGGLYSKTWWSLQDAAYSGTNALSETNNWNSAIKHKVERLNYRAGYMIRPFDLDDNTFEDMIIGNGVYIDSPSRPNPIYHVENSNDTHNNQGGNVNNQFASKIFITAPLEDTVDEVNKSKLYICDPTFEYPDILHQIEKQTYKRNSGGSSYSTNEFNALAGDVNTSYEPILSGKIHDYITAASTATNPHKNAEICPLVEIASADCEQHDRNKFAIMGAQENGFSGQMITIVDAATGTMQTRQILASVTNTNLFLAVHFPFGHLPAVNDLFYIWSHRHACTSSIRLFKEKELDFSFALDGVNTVALKADPTLSAPIYKSTGAIASTSGAGGVLTVTTSAIHNLSTNDVVKIIDTDSYDETYAITVTGPKTFTFAHASTANETGNWELAELAGDDSSVSNPIKVDSSHPLVLSTFGGLDMRKTRGVTINAITDNTNDITLTATANHFFDVGDTVTFQSTTNAQDGVYPITADNGSTTFDITNIDHTDDTNTWPITTNQWENILMSTAGIGATAEVRVGFNASDTGQSQGNLIRTDNSTATDELKYLNVTDASVKISSPSIGDETGDYFLKNKTYDYKVSLMYDGYQEGALSHSTWTHNDKHDKTRRKLAIEISVMNYSKRLTAVCLYRRDDKDTFFRLVKQIPTNAGWKYDGTSYKHTVDDTGPVQASYNARTGRSEVLDSIKLKYGISVEIDGFLFAADCSHENIENAENQIFRSKPGQYSIFDYASDFLQLKSKPVALANFGGRLYAFDKSNTYRINQQNLNIEDIYEGIGCLSKDSVIVTEYGMFFADKNGAYFHDGQSPKKISGPIEQGGGTDNEWGGTDNIRDVSWQGIVGNSLSSIPYVTFESKSSSILFFATYNDYNSSTTLATEKQYVWSYNLIKSRWDLWEVAQDASIGVPIIADKGAVLIPIDNLLYEFKGGTSKRDYTWLSKKLTMEEDSILKVYNKVKINGISDNLNLGGEYKESSDKLLIKTSVGDISSSDLTYKSISGNHSEYRLKSTNKKGRWVQFKLEDMTKAVDSIGLIYRRKSTK